MLHGAMRNYSNDMEGTEGENSFTCFSTWGVIIATINLISVAINVLHLVILTSMNVLNGRPYKLVLINITIADISTSFMLSLTYSCLPALPIIKKATPNFGLVLLLIEWPLYASNWIFLVASVEQYYGICRPFRYETLSFIRKLRFVLVMTWVLSFFAMVFTAATVEIVRARGASSSMTFLAVNLSSRYVPLIVAGIFFVIIMRQLKKLRGDDLRLNQECDRRITVYFIIIYSIFCAFAFVDVAMTCIAIFNSGILPFHSQRVRNISRPLYGIANTIIYGFRTSAYQKHMFKMFCKRSR